VRAFVVAVLALAPGCDGGEPLRDFTITEPGLLGDAARTSMGTSLAVAWDADADADLDVVLRLEGVTWAIEPGRIGLYRLHADVLDGDALQGSFAGGQVMLPGVEFRDATLDFAGSSSERDVWITVAGLTPLDVTIEVSSGSGVVGTLGQAIVATDLAPIGRVFAWDAQLPAGSYTLRARIEREGVTFVDGATQVTWRPAD